MRRGCQEQQQAALGRALLRANRRRLRSVQKRCSGAARLVIWTGRSGGCAFTAAVIINDRCSRRGTVGRWHSSGPPSCWASSQASAASSGAGGEAIILFIVLAPAIGLLCLAALVMLGVSRTRTDTATHMAGGALPAALGCRTRWLAAQPRCSQRRTAHPTYRALLMDR